MSNVTEQNAERNTRAIGQNDQMPPENECPIGAAAAETPDDSASPQPQLSVVIEGQHQLVPFDELSDPARRLQFKQWCEATASPVTFHVTAFFSWPAAARFMLLTFVQELGDQVRLQIGDDQEHHPNVFDAIIAAFPTAIDTAAQTAAKQAAIEAAALFLQGTMWPAAAISVADVLTAIGAEDSPALEIFNRIRAVAAIEPNYESIAAHFHGCLQLETQTPAGEPAIRNFRDEFYIWNRRTWQRVDDRELKARVVRHIQQAFPGEASDTLVNNVILNLKGQTLLNAGQLQIPFWIESESPLVTHTPPLVIFQNGIVDISDRDMYEDGPTAPQLYPHDPRCFSTVALPYAYDPMAICPLWQQTLGEIFPLEHDDDNRVPVLQEFMGLTLFPNQMRHEKFLITVGHGANGKSTVLRVWEQLLGPHNVCHAPLEALGKDSHLYGMLGKLANIASDMKRMEKTEEGRLKMLVSGEPIQVDRKYKSALTMVPTARLIFACNELPPINDRSDGIWRRMIAMPFNRQFREEERDLDRSERLMAELPGIFNWALAGAVRLFEQGGFTRCEVCDQCAGEHRQHSDSFLEFWEEMVDVGSGKSVLTDDLYRVYVEYCQNNGRRPKSNSEVGKQVVRMEGVTKVRRSGADRKYEYRGVGLRTSAYPGFSQRSGLPRIAMPLPSEN